MPESYPAAPAARDRWILARRGPRAPLDPWRPVGSFVEEERGPSGALLPSATVLVANRTCAFRCLMCDLWRHTLDETVPAGAIPAQIRRALAELPPVRQVKLYNAGSFFDPGAIPPGDDAAIAAAVESAERVIVEAHPAFLAGEHGARCLRFRDRIRGQLEVAIGLETVHPTVLPRLNKRMTVEDFRRAADFLRRHGVDLRVFVLLKPPFLSEAEAVEWAGRTIDVAIEHGATACSVIPVRRGNGALEALGEAFSPPKLSSLEAAVERGVSRGACRVFADLWGLDGAGGCVCAPRRLSRLAAVNRTQAIPAPVVCEACGVAG